MTGATGNSHAIWPNELVVTVIVRVADEACAVPFLARFIVEFRIGKEPKPKDAGWFAINFSSIPGGSGSACSSSHSPNSSGLVAARKPGSLTSPSVLKRSPRWIFAVVEHLQQIHQPVAVLCDMIPEMFVAAAPKIPSVAAHDLFGESAMPPSIGLKTSAVICGKSLVRFARPAFASSSGGGLRQPAAKRRKTAGRSPNGRNGIAGVRMFHSTPVPGEFSGACTRMKFVNPVGRRRVLRQENSSLAEGSHRLW